MNNLLPILASNAYRIVKTAFFASLVIVFILKFFVDKIPVVITAAFFLIAGIFIGFILSSYSMRLLQREKTKRKLPMN